ncbi:MAG: FemAB family XrtA/PEP-CTERM system-associated protein [Rhodothalassiaceae bacterium]
MMHAPVDIAVAPLSPDQQAEWDAFVTEHPDGSFYHLSGWKRVFERAFGHQTYLLAARQAGSLAGVLPLVHMKSAVFGNRLISVAFMVYGGPLANSEAAAARLDEAALALADQLDADFIEYRCRAAEPARAGWQSRSDRHVTFRKPILPTDEDNLKAIPRKQRAEVRKALKAGLASEPVGDVDDLHRIMNISYRNLGTPSFSRRYFHTLQQEWGSAAQTLVIKHGTEPIAAVMSFFFRDEVLPYYGGATLAARRYSANDFMYWEVMRRACADGYKMFDFGRSKVGTGAYNFKKYWGFEPEPLHYHYHLRKGGEVPDASPANPKYQAAIRVWRRLPLWLTRHAGPLVSRQLG